MRRRKSASTKSARVASKSKMALKRRTSSPRKTTRKSKPKRR